MTMAMRCLTLFSVVLTVASILGSVWPVLAQDQDWIEPVSGLEIRSFQAPGASGSGLLAVVRADPGRFKIRLAMATELGGRPDTVKAWAWRTGMVAAINAGMYRADDTLRSTGYMRRGGHVNNGYVNPGYGAFLVFEPDNATLPAVRIVDRAEEPWEELVARYRTVIQNYRMVSIHGENLWPEDGPRISIAAVGLDRQGRILFMHSSTPRTQHEFNKVILGLPLEVHNAMYVEGGPEACLYVRAGEMERVWTGTTGRGLWRAESDQLWPVPNVLGLVPK
ncbi:MAG: phosphodiester glycosidase family protein [Deltaproteobacteria bacterium]|nr:phosphodiester glycosidase family protein [Deltaproteobacteria bacterium]